MADLQRLFDLADPRIRGIWDEKQTQLSTRLDYADFGFADQNAEILDSKFENFTGLGIAQATGEKEPYSREDLNYGYNVTITPKKFTKAIDITEEMLRFNLWPKINNLVGGVANALNARINTDVAKIFYLGFGTTFVTGGDSVALFSASHPTSPTDSTLQSNTGGTAPLSYDNLKAAIQAMDRFTDDKGIQLLPCQKLKLIVARENKERAMEVLKSIGNPDSANRLSNVFLTETGSIELKVAYWIPKTTYSKYWFVVDMERANMMAKMMWGWKSRFDDDKVINNGTKVYTGSVMFAPGFQSWQWAYGSAATT
jgi:hypothetical protein